MLRALVETYLYCEEPFAIHSLLDRIVNGQIAERWDVSIMLSMLLQLGVIPAPGM